MHAAGSCADKGASVQCGCVRANNCYDEFRLSRRSVQFVDQENARVLGGVTKHNTPEVAILGHEYTLVCKSLRKQGLIARIVVTFARPNHIVAKLAQLRHRGSDNVGVRKQTHDSFRSDGEAGLVRAGSEALRIEQARLNIGWLQKGELIEDFFPRDAHGEIAEDHFHSDAPAAHDGPPAHRVRVYDDASEELPVSVHENSIAEVSRL